MVSKASKLLHVWTVYLVKLMTVIMLWPGQILYKIPPASLVFVMQSSMLNYTEINAVGPSNSDPVIFLWFPPDFAPQMRTSSYHIAWFGGNWHVLDWGLIAAKKVVLWCRTVFNFTQSPSAKYAMKLQRKQHSYACCVLGTHNLASSNGLLHLGANPHEELMKSNLPHVFEDYTFKITTISPRGQWIIYLDTYYSYLLLPSECWLL